MDRVANTVLVLLPVEIIYKILLLLSPQDVIRLRRVSKQLCAIINDPTFWRTAYASASLARPPGPFSWQSTNFLQRTLVRSARLAQRWISQPINVVSTHSVKLGSHDDRECKWVCRRWLINCMTKKQLVSYDIETGTKQTLCQWDDFKWISWSATCCMMSTRGHLLYVGLCIEDGHSGYNSGKLLEFRADDDSGHLSGPIAFDIPHIYLMSTLSDTIRIVGGDTPFVFITTDLWNLHRTCCLIFDTRNKIFYRFPTTKSKLDTETPFPQFTYFGKILLTGTHIILSYASSAINSSSQLVQAYVIPDGDESDELRLSHETITNIERLLSQLLLRNSVIDPLTGSTNLRLLQDLRLSHDSQFLCIDITLPANSTEDILPVSIDRHVVFSMTNGSYGIGTELILSSADGFARGLCIVGSIPNKEIHVRRLSIDATGEQCVGVIGDTFPLSRLVDHHRWRMKLFDPIRGRIFFRVAQQNDYDTPVPVALCFE